MNFRSIQRSTHRFGPIDWLQSYSGSRLRRICLEWKEPSDTSYARARSVLHPVRGGPDARMEWKSTFSCRPHDVKSMQVGHEARRRLSVGWLINKSRCRISAHVEAPSNCSFLVRWSSYLPIRVFTATVTGSWLSPSRHLWTEPNAPVPISSPQISLLMSISHSSVVCLRTREKCNHLVIYGKYYSANGLVFRMAHGLPIKVVFYGWASLVERHPNQTREKTQSEGAQIQTRVTWSEAKCTTH